MRILAAVQCKCGRELSMVKFFLHGNCLYFECLPCPDCGSAREAIGFERGLKSEASKETVMVEASYKQAESNAFASVKS